jgi:hypothetical protein
VITSKRVTGWLQYTLDIWARNAGTDITPDGFNLEIPADAKQSAPEQIPELNEIPAIFSAK